MASHIFEFYGYPPLSESGKAYVETEHCPFVDDKCKKRHGACSLKPLGSEPVIICPNRLYAKNHVILRDISDRIFGEDLELCSKSAIGTRVRNGTLTGKEVAVFGQYFDGEISIPSPKAPGAKRGGQFKIDYVLAKLNQDGNLGEFAAVEVQSIDTTGTYAPAAEAFKRFETYLNDKDGDTSSAGLNWENVSKRILPQIIYKGHALRREKSCKKGLFFVLPQPVYERILVRLGSDLLEHHPGPGTVTFMTYDLDLLTASPFALKSITTFTTTVDQIAYAFVSPQNLPSAGSYETAIQNALTNSRR